MSVRNSHGEEYVFDERVFLQIDMAKYRRPRWMRPEGSGPCWLMLTVQALDGRVLARAKVTDDAPLYDMFDIALARVHSMYRTSVRERNIGKEMQAVMAFFEEQEQANNV